MPVTANKIMKILLITFIASWAGCAYACINGDTQELADGTFLYEDPEGHVIPRGHVFHLDEADETLRNLDSLWRTTHEVNFRSDYALLLILLKRYKEAEAIYLEIEKQFPGRYSTASNLGTLYELTGDNQKALLWISKAVAIDPKSHFGSEWLHVNILKAKIEGEHAYTTRFLLGTDFGEYVIPSTKLSEGQLSLMRDALYYQLNERMSFINPPDKIVSVLLAALGDVCWLTGMQVPAAENYHKAIEYDRTNQLSASKFRRAQEKQIAIPIGEVKDSRDYSSLYFVVGVCFISIAVISMRKWRERK